MPAFLAALFAVLVGLTGSLRAQVAPSAQKALEAFTALQDKPEAERANAARALGRFADDEVTRTLLRALSAAGEESLRTALVDALGQVKRDGVVDTLAGLLSSFQTSPMLRNAAARGLAKQGAAGIAELQRVAVMPGSEPAITTARSYAMSGLSTANDEAAWKTLAAICKDGAIFERRNAIRYLNRAPDLEEVRVAIVAAAADKDFLLAAAAVRMLAERKLPDARARVWNVLEHIEPAYLQTVRVDLLEAMLAVFDSGLFDRFLEVAAGPAGYAQQQVDDAVGKAAKDAEFISWLRKEAIRRKEPAERVLAIRVLGQVKGDDITAQLVSFVKQKEPEVVTAALRALGARGDQSVLPDLRKLLRGKPDERRTELLACLHQLQRADKEWHAELLGMLNGAERNRDAALHALLLDLLADVGSVEALSSAWKAFTAKNWTVRAAAYDFCKAVRDARSVPLLMARLDEESGRLREDVLDTLMSLTSMRFNDLRHWQEWWKAHSADFQLVPAGAVQKHRPRQDQGATVSYYGIPLVSDRVVFVVDVSGSMSAKVGTGGTRTRLDEAKAQLHRVVESIPKQFRFNIVPFHTTVSAVLDKMMPAVDATRAQALGEIDALEPLGGTNVHAALKRAFDEPEVDTIYLLSDGAPSAGEIVDPNALADEVARWNKTRRVRIHCISIGADSPMMKRLAAESGGEYGVYN